MISRLSFLHRNLVENLNIDYYKEFIIPQKEHLFFLLHKALYGLKKNFLRLFCKGESFYTHIKKGITPFRSSIKVYRNKNNDKNEMKNRKMWMPFILIIWFIFIF